MQTSFFRTFALVFACLLVTGCARGLTDAEERFAKDIFGDGLDTSKVRVAHGFGILPPAKTVPRETRLVEGTDQACLRVPQPRQTRSPQAFAIGNRLHFETGLYSSDMVMRWPGGLRLPQAIIFAHELTHAWHVRASVDTVAGINEGQISRYTAMA